MKKIAVTGASGFIGRRLVSELVRRGYPVVALGRRPETGFEAGVEWRRFDPHDAAPNPAAFEGTGAVVHLAGETVAGRWTPEKKREIHDSRVYGTRLVVASMAACSVRPTVLVSASASGYYGSRADEPLFESSAPGTDFLANVCSGWEQESRRAEMRGIRSVQLRAGIVLGPGGALQQMLPPFRLGAGGPFGTGSQFVPWIHIDDLVALYIFALEREDARGPVNAAAPDYATSARFAQALGAAVGRPALVPAPPFALRMLLGEFAGTLTASQLMIPAVAEDAGFDWKRPNLEAALIDVAGAGRKTPALRRFASRQFVPSTLENVFSFFAKAQNLEAITPPMLRFSIRSIPDTMERGTQIAYRLRLHGLPFQWKTMIARWNPPYEFVDVQLHGPYALWQHTHRFCPVDGGVEISDEVLYALPFAPLGNAVAPIVEADVRGIFAHRRAVIERVFGSGRVSTQSGEPVSAASAP